MREFVNEFDRRLARQLRRGFELLPFVVRNAINAAHVYRRIEAAVENLFAEIRHHENDVFDDAAVQIANVQRAVGARPGTDWAKPFIARSQEFATVESVTSLQVRAVAFEQVHADEIAARLGNDRRAAKLGRELIAAVDRGAAGDRESFKRAVFAEFGAAQGDARRDADREDLVGVGTQVDVQARVGGATAERRLHVLVAKRVFGRNQIDVQRRVFVVVEESPDVVLRDAPLAAKGGRLFDQFAVDEAVPHGRLGVVHPIVHRVEQAVVGVLGVARLSVLADEFLRIAFHVAVGVAAVPEVRRLGDEDAPSDERHGPRHDELIEEHGRLVVERVAVGVFQDDDLADRVPFAGPVHIEHPAAHLDDPHPPVGIELETDRIGDERLMGHAFELKARRDLE